MWIRPDDALPPEALYLPHVLGVVACPAMKPLVLVQEQFVAHPKEKVFAFFSDASNLEKLTPFYMGLRNVGPTKMQTGTVVEYRILLGPFPIRWKSLIEVFDPGERFIDRQIRGPYAYFRHTHEFNERDGGTLLVDRVEYAPPLGLLGRILLGPITRFALNRIFTYRKRALDMLFR